MQTLDLEGQTNTSHTQTHTDKPSFEYAGEIQSTLDTGSVHSAYARNVSTHGR